MGPNAAGGALPLAADPPILPLDETVPRQHDKNGGVFDERSLTLLLTRPELARVKI